MRKRYENTSLAAAITISLSSISTLAQEALIEFVDGEIASAEDVNSNFQHLHTRLNAIEQFGGCSVTQDGSSIVITCADGTSGVLASAGTVVVVPEASVTPNPAAVFKTGEIYVVDANGMLLASGGNGLEYDNQGIVRLRGGLEGEGRYLGNISDFRDPSACSFTDGRVTWSAMITVDTKPALISV